MIFISMLNFDTSHGAYVSFWFTICRFVSVVVSIDVVQVLSSRVSVIGCVQFMFPLIRARALYFDIEGIFSMSF